MPPNFHVRSPWSTSSGRLQTRLRDWSTSLLRTGWESWASSALRRDEWEETSSMSVRICRVVEEDGPRLFSVVPSKRARDNGWDRCPGSSSWVWGRTSSQCVTEPCNRLPREGVESSKDCLHANLCPVLQDDPAWTGWTRQATMVSSNLTCSVITRRTVPCRWVFF